MRGMMNLLKVAIVAAGGGKRVAQRYGVHAVSVSRWVSGTNAFPPDHVRDLCEQGGNIVDPDRLAAWLADREAAKTRARVLEKAAA
jgi:hypothetical protein